MSDPLTLADWRRQVAEIYADVRGAAEPAAAWTVWRERRDGLFREHAESPVRGQRTFASLPFHAYDPAWRFEAEYQLADGADVTWPAGADGSVSGRPFAHTVGLEPKLGSELTLFWLTGYGGGVFLPFADTTNGISTYGGGRYLLDGIKGADLGVRDGRLILDFNFAYNPSCAYSPEWVCPLAPAEYRVDVPITAGEKTPRPD